MARRISMALAIGILTAALTGVLLPGCSGDDVKPAKDVINKEFDDAPCWVLQGCSCLDTEGKICGVGSVSGTRNPSLARSTALARARTEIARSLNVRVQSMLRDYQATSTGGEEFGIAAADEQFIEDTTKQITDLTLTGVEPVDSWISESGTLYVLAELDAEEFKEALEQMTNLSEEIRKAIAERAEEAFLRLDAELEK